MIVAEIQRIEGCAPRSLGMQADARRQPGADLHHASAVSQQAERGFGAGTLYRHLPSREALPVAVYRKEIDALLALAPRLLDPQWPLEASCLWCQRFAEFGGVKHGIVDSLHAATSNQDLEETYWSLVDAVCRLMSACEEVGAMASGTS